MHSFVFTVHLRHSEDIRRHTVCKQIIITAYVFFMGSFYFHNPANDPHSPCLPLSRAYGKKNLLTPLPPPKKRKLGSSPPPHMLACPEVEIKIALFLIMEDK